MNLVWVGSLVLSSIHSCLNFGLNKVCIYDMWSLWRTNMQIMILCINLPLGSVNYDHGFATNWWEQWLCLSVGHVSEVGLNDNDIVLLAPAYLVQSIMLWCWSCQSLNKQAAGCKTLLSQPQRFHTSVSTILVLFVPYTALYNIYYTVLVLSVQFRFHTTGTICTRSAPRTSVHRRKG